MGIRYLNRILRTNCAEYVRCINLADLSGKKIAVDVSIYMYKYETDDLLIENIYLMISIFLHYNITPIFIFDGKPPDEKKELLKKRREEKMDAEKEYNKLKTRFDDNDAALDEEQKQELVSNMDQLKKQFVYINKDKIRRVKELIASCGVTYYDAPGEADELCALLVIKKKVWACMSEDMDLFVYGCTRVLRYFSLVNHTAVLYYMKGILTEINMNQDEFREICVISGTDYNINANGCENKITIDGFVKLFRRYKNSGQSCGFYTWLINTEEHEHDIDLLKRINEMFDLSSKHDNLKNFERIRIANCQGDRDAMKAILEEDGFIFLD